MFVFCAPVRSSQKPASFACATKQLQPSAVYRHWRLCRPCQAFHARRGCASRAGDQGLSIRGRGQPLLVSPPPQIVVAVSPDAKGVEAGEGRRAP
jgi:hypothetical protein